MPDSINWTAVGGFVTGVATNAAAVWMFLRKDKSDGRKTDQELRLKADGQEFDQGKELWDSLRGLGKELDDARKETLKLQGDLVRLEGQLNRATIENENLRRVNEEQAREYTGRQALTDKVVADLRAALELAGVELTAARGDRERMQIELCTLRARMERMPDGAWESGN